MLTETGSNVAASPLLFRYATPRTSGAPLPGHYDAESQTWVIETSTGLMPVVQTGDPALLDTNTQTRVRQEGDDEDMANDALRGGALLDTSTLTKVRQEGDDDDMGTEELLGGARRTSALAELATKTAVNQESDDQITTSGLLELETRSANNQEAIDEDWPLLFALETRTFVAVEEDDDSVLAQ